MTGAAYNAPALGSGMDALPDDADEVDLALAHCHEYVSAPTFRMAADRHGFRFGGLFASLRQAWRGPGIAVARFVPSQRPPDPVVWETALQTLLLALPDGPAMLPVAFERVEAGPTPPGEFWAVATVRPATAGASPVVDLRVYDDRQRSRGRLSGIVVYAGAPAGPPVVPARTKIGRRLRALVRRADRPRNPAARRCVPTAPPAPPVPTATGAPARAQLVLLEQAASVLGTTADRIDPRRPLRDLGLDSLMATQLAARMREVTGGTVPTDRLLGSESVGGLAELFG